MQRVSQNLKFKSTNTTNTPIKVNGDIFFHPVDKANSINNYFTSVSNIDSEPDLPDVPPLALCELSGIVINEQEVYDQFQILNISKPAGPDNLPPKFLKAVFQSLVKPLTILFQKSLNFGVVPGDWKLANVSPIYKGKGGSDNVANYRPISVTNCFIKILEKIIFKHLHNYLLRYNKLSDDQSGFRHRDSTINQLLVIYDVIMKNLDIGKDVRFIFCDISKAFDRVWHRGLLYKLRKYGIKGNLLTWFGSYLSDRKQRVCMNGYYSTWNSINAGVPQGSILGNLLFLLFINDIVDVVSNSMKLFADDTSLYCIVDDQNETAESLNSDLNSLSTWASDWCVNFNASKTKPMLFTRKHDVNIPPLYMNDDVNIPPLYINDDVNITPLYMNDDVNIPPLYMNDDVNIPPLYMNDDVLEDVLKHKHLGIHFCSNGTWKDHINEIYKKACSRLNILRMMKHNLDRNSLEKLYFGFIRPILEYGSVVWDNCTREQSDLIESVQYESARIVTGLRKGTSRVKLYGELGWDSLQNRRKKQKLILMFKALEGELPNYITNNIISYINIEPNYMVRNPRLFTPPQCRTKSYKDSFFPTVLDLWNKLDNDTRNIQSLSSFKIKLNKDVDKSPSFYSIGSRSLNIWHCQLRNEASSLNHHLFQSHLSDSSQCACGDAIENNFHYFYVCPLFIRHRIQLFNSLRKFQDVLNLDILLKGSPILTVEENTEIFDAVHHFIIGSRRFT